LVNIYLSAASFPLSLRQRQAPNEAEIFMQNVTKGKEWKNAESWGRMLSQNFASGQKKVKGDGEG